MSNYYPLLTMSWSTFSYILLLRSLVRYGIGEFWNLSVLAGTGLYNSFSDLVETFGSSANSNQLLYFTLLLHFFANFKHRCSLLCSRVSIPRFSTANLYPLYFLPNIIAHAAFCTRSNHFSTLGATRLVEKVSIDQLTLAGLSTNISVDRPANLGWCMVNPQTSWPWLVYGQFSV